MTKKADKGGQVKADTLFLSSFSVGNPPLGGFRLKRTCPSSLSAFK
jgi:hypothetical protein